MAKSCGGQVLGEVTAFGEHPLMVEQSGQVLLSPAAPTIENEIEAMKVIGNALLPLTEEARGRVLAWAQRYFFPNRGY